MLYVIYYTTILYIIYIYIFQNSVQLQPSGAYNTRCMQKNSQSWKNKLVRLVRKLAIIIDRFHNGYVIAKTKVPADNFKPTCWFLVLKQLDNL